MARYIAAAVVITLVASTAATIGIRYFSSRAALEESARRFAALVSGPLVQIAYMYGEDGIRAFERTRVARLMQLNPDVERLEILRDDRSVVFSASQDNARAWPDTGAPSSIEDLGMLKSIRSEAITDADRVRIDGRTVYRVIVPGSAGEQPYPFPLVATFSYERVNQQLRRGVLYVALTLVLGLFLTERVAALLARGITRNIGRLQAGVRRIRSGRLDERVEIGSGDEIEELAEAFNEMTEELQQTIGRLRQANRELYALDQVKIDLVANVSHELRTPLTALKGYLELLDDGELGSLNPKALRAVNVCRRNVDRLTLRVDDLVALSQMEKSWPEQTPKEPFDMIQLVSTVVEGYEIPIRAKRLQLSMNTPAALPMVDGIEEQVERVVINLLDNAVKFTPEGGRVLLGLEESDHDGREGVLLQVVDSGIGIPKSELIRIFDRFHQVDPSVRRRFGGMGLGLSLVHHIVENHRGVVWAESEGGKGASFLVWLPSTPKIGATQV